MINGNPVAVREIRAVVTRRPAVVAEELSSVDPEDRSYLAAETNAFLVAWLAAIPCCVLNRPTPTSLSGPAWTDIHWRAAAARAGVPWAVDISGGSGTYDVLVCGDRCVGARSRADVDRARRLARAAGVHLLGVRFRGGRIGAASVWPDLSGEEEQAVVLEHLLSAPRIRGR